VTPTTRYRHCNRRTHGVDATSVGATAHSHTDSDNRSQRLSHSVTVSNGYPVTPPDCHLCVTLRLPSRRPRPPRRYLCGNPPVAFAPRRRTYGVNPSSLALAQSSARRSAGCDGCQRGAAEIQRGAAKIPAGEPAVSSDRRRCCPRRKTTRSQATPSAVACQRETGLTRFAILQ